MSHIVLQHLEFVNIFTCGNQFILTSHWVTPGSLSLTPIFWLCADGLHINRYLDDTPSGTSATGERSATASGSVVWAKGGLSLLLLL